jgi:hypothetical protein
MKKIKTAALLAEWLADKIDPNDTESIAAFHTWLESGHRGRLECFVAQEAWSELLQSNREKTLH